MDTLSPASRSERMSRIRGKHSKAEIAVRRMIYGMGFRYRLHRNDLPGRPDIVFPRRRKVIFVHGCFWHRHPDPKCPLARLPKSRLDFWGPKLEGNRQRDKAKQDALRLLGWQFAIVWECELRHKEHVENKIRGFLECEDGDDCH
jgi:DNA mismatch endonuclease, patch repair protein